MKRDNTKKQKSRFMLLMMLYSFVMLFAVVLALSISKSSKNNDVPTDIGQVVIQTEYIYVQPEGDTSPSVDIDSTYGEQVYIVREYMDIVGIFLPDGILFDTIDVYVKTLPEADRRLLREGFEVVGDKALWEIIQDFDS